MDEWVRVDGVEEQAPTEAPAPRQPARSVPGDVATAIRKAAVDATANRKEKLVGQMGRAIEAYDRHRFEEASRLANRLAQDAPGVAEVLELAGLASYRAQIWRPAARNLLAYRELTDDPDYLPLEMDCARAVGRPRAVGDLFELLRQSSPEPDVLAEGRLVLAGSMADRGKIAEAIELLEAAGAGKTRRNPGDRHIRQWYLLADLYDRAGDAPHARALFTMVQQADPRAYDVGQRLKDLGPVRRSRPRSKPQKP